jgi:hypothetical protein
MKQFLFLSLLFASSTLLLAQSTQNDMEKFGFIYPRTDSLGVPLYIDGVFIGENPLDEPIPVFPGFHEVSYLPPEISEQFIKHKLVESVKRVYITANDTLDVFLFYDSYATQVKFLRTEAKVQSYVGMGLILILMSLIFSAL